MSEEPKPWERQPNEPLNWYKRFTAFRLMEPLHSIPDVFRQEQPEGKRGKQRNDPPGTWYEIAKTWRWEERASAWDASETQRIEASIAREKEKALRRGYALMHKRIDALSEVAYQLEGYMRNETRVWLADAKIVATGAGLAERVDLEVFNSDLFREYRECLTDIADEMGDRIKKSDVTVSSQVVVREAPHGLLGETHE